MQFPSDALVQNSLFNTDNRKQELYLPMVINDNEESELLPIQEVIEDPNISTCEKLRKALCYVFAIACFIGGALFIGMLAHAAGAGPVLSVLLGLGCTLTALCAVSTQDNYPSEGFPLSHAL